MKVSIIIPVFNVAPYLPKCIESCLAQDMPATDFELILIDDGSTDDSSLICREYQRQHPRIHFFSQSNAGQGAARNVGLARARGRFVWFVDADDWISANCLRRIIRICEEQKLDMLGFSGILEGAGDQQNNLYPASLAGVEISGRDFLCDHDPTTCTPLYLFRRRFLRDNQICFLPGVFHEDEDFVYRALYSCKKISFIDDVLYYINPRAGSTTRSANPGKAYDLLQVCRSLSTYMKYHVAVGYRPVFHDRIATLINQALLHGLPLEGESAAQLNRTFYENRDLFGHLRKSSRFKDRLEGWLLMLFSRHPLGLFKKLMRR